MKTALFFIVLFVASTVTWADDTKVCTNNSTYPPKIVIVHKSQQCPPGYY